MTEYLTQNNIRESIAADRKRQRILNKVLNPISSIFLESVLLTKSIQNILDLGCGVGEGTFILGKILDHQTVVKGVDMNFDHLKVAREKARYLDRNKISFQYQNILEWREVEIYDAVYSRLLFGKISQPRLVLKNIHHSLKEGGCILLEEFDYSDNFSYPHCYAFDHYLELYTRLRRKQHIDACIGSKLVDDLRTVGFQKIQVKLVPPLILFNHNKQFTSLSLKSVSPFLLKEQLLLPIELEILLQELESFEKQEGSLITLPCIYQVWGYKL